MVSLFLIVYPLGQLYYLWSHHSLSTWLLAVSAFSVEVVIKVLISLVIYVLFFVDSYKTTFWEELDDYVYYVRGIGSTVSNHFFFVCTHLSSFNWYSSIVKFFDFVKINAIDKVKIEGKGTNLFLYIFQQQQQQ